MTAAANSIGEYAARGRDAFEGDPALYLAPEARFEHLLTLPEQAQAGKALNDAMKAVERDNPELKDVLPRSFQVFGSVLLKNLLKRISEIPANLEYDAFGRIYEYFLGEFASLTTTLAVKGKRRNF